MTRLSANEAPAIRGSVRGANPVGVWIGGWERTRLFLVEVPFERAFAVVETVDHIHGEVRRAVDGEVALTEYVDMWRISWVGDGDRSQASGG